MNPVGPPRDGAGLAVESLGPGVREARSDVGQDARGVLGDRERDTLERFEAGASYPSCDTASRRAPLLSLFLSLLYHAQVGSA